MPFVQYTILTHYADIFVLKDNANIMTALINNPNTVLKRKKKKTWNETTLLDHNLKEHILKLPN